MISQAGADEVEFCELTDAPAHFELLERVYGDIYIKEFPHPDERESLANMQRYLSLKAAGWYGKNNYHIVIAMIDGAPAGLVVLDYLEEPNCGVIEFLAISENRRRTGLGTRLLAQAESLLDSDGKNHDRPSVALIMAEMNDPFAPNSLEDNLDPFHRAVVWSKWGYRRLQFPYVQPSLSAGQAPVRNLLLMAKAVDERYADSVPANLLLAALRGYMKWAMRIDRPEHNEEYEAMRSFIKSGMRIAMMPLDEYVGESAERPLLVREIADAGDPDLNATLEAYRAAFPGAVTDVSPEEMVAFLSPEQGRSWAYHLWALRANGSAPVEGIASFFSFGAAGFGGYVALSGSLRGTGRFSLLLARMEQAIRRDAPEARGLYIECEAAKESYFAQFGFRTLDFTYLQPPLRSSAPYPPDQAPQLKLMYKELGAAYALPALTTDAFFSALSEIFRIVYGVADPQTSPFFGAMRRQAEKWPGGRVRFTRSFSASGRSGIFRRLGWKR